MKTFLFCLALICYAPAYAGTVSDFYQPIGPAEQLIAPFNHSTEETTANPYNGYLALHFSGYGQNNPTEWMDAFWFFHNGNVSDWVPRKQGFGLAFDGHNVLQDGGIYGYSLGDTTDTINIHNSLFLITYNNDVGLYDGLNTSGIPKFRVDHEYDIVLFINGPPRIINFGFLDGGTSDNNGEVDITLTPVKPLGLTIGSSVPEPTTFVFLVLATLIIALRRYFAS